ncbi:hypothetical protein OL229_16575 [Neisseriaceae bacterium JH1-16]|nr:hypothetical protein [Neisseriaceae bacterium JH1-16]
MEKYLKYYNFDPIQLIYCGNGSERYFRLLAFDNSRYDNRIDERWLLANNPAAILESLSLQPDSPCKVTLKTEYANHRFTFQSYDSQARRHHGRWSSFSWFTFHWGFARFSVSNDTLDHFQRDLRQHLQNPTQTIASRT